MSGGNPFREGDVIRDDYREALDALDLAKRVINAYRADNRELREEIKRLRHQLILKQLKS
jgi:hypothetical protein